MLRIDWRLGPPYPMGIQDNSVGVVDGKIVSAGGFSRHPKDILQTHPDIFGGEPSGFTNATFIFDPRNEAAGWTRIADRPGVPRQGAGTAVVGDEMWTFGGFSYTEPLCFRDVCRLRQVQGDWVWETMDACPLPWPMCWPGVAVIGTKVYLIGGVDYFQPEGEEGPDLHTEAGREGNPVGNAVWVLDTAALDQGWQRLADLPGTARGLGGVGVVGGKIYVLGGFHGALHKSPEGRTYFNVVDSWVYNPATNAWDRLRDMPHGCNHGVVTYRDRYVILLGGYKYPQTQNPDGTRTDCYSAQEQALDWKDLFQKWVFVYDTQTGELGTADELLDVDNGPVAVIIDDTIYYLGSEGGSGLWHPDTFPIGRIVGVL
jgi:hypothetical protein